jgi:hypothetical protein
MRTCADPFRHSCCQEHGPARSPLLHGPDDGRHGGTAAENAQAPTPLIPEIMQGKRRSARIANWRSSPRPAHQRRRADSGASTPPEMIGRHGGTPNMAGAANNQTTRLSTAQGCVATDTHCVSLTGAALQGTPSSQPTPVPWWTGRHASVSQGMTGPRGAGRPTSWAAGAGGRVDAPPRWLRVVHSQGPPLAALQTIGVIATVIASIMDDVPQWAGRPHRPRIVSRPFPC